MCGKPEVSDQCDRPKPELCRQIVAIDVNVSWLVWLMAEEVHTIRPTPQDSRHRSILPSLSRTSPASLNRDVRECNERAAESEPASGAKTGAISDAFRKLRVETAFNDCMIAKGYQETKSLPTAD